MQNYKLTIHTEEVKGRYEKTEIYSRMTEEEVYAAIQREIASIKDVIDITIVDCDNYIINHSPKLQTTLTISEM